MKKLFLSILLLALPLLASAYDCQVDGIYYNLIPKGNVAEVTYQKVENGYHSDYSGYVTIPEKFTYEGVEYSVTSIGNYAFWECTGLTSLTIPNSVTTIGIEAFLDCTGLTSLTIPNSVTSIGSYVFASCSRLTSITIGNSVTSIGGWAFYGCSGLTSVSIPNSVTSIGSAAFYECSGLTSVTIPNSVTTIGDCAFYRCSGLTSMTICNSVTSIGNYAFWECTGLTSVTIPNSVTYIGYNAFNGCVGLTTLISEVEIPCYIDENCFPADVFKHSTLYVPKGTVDKYKSTDYWSKFVFIEESDPTDIIQVSSDDLLISAQNGTITVRGEQNGLPLTVYTADGKMLGSATIKDGQASISTNLQRGVIAIVKAGTRSVKMLMK